MYWLLSNGADRNKIWITWLYALISHHVMADTREIKVAMAAVNPFIHFPQPAAYHWGQNSIPVYSWQNACNHHETLLAHDTMNTEMNGKPKSSFARPSDYVVSGGFRECGGEHIKGKNAHIWFHSVAESNMCHGFSAAQHLLASNRAASSMQLWEGTVQPLSSKAFSAFHPDDQCHIVNRFNSYIKPV